MKKYNFISHDNTSLFDIYEYSDLYRHEQIKRRENRRVTILLGLMVVAFLIAALIDSATM